MDKKDPHDLESAHYQPLIPLATRESIPFITDHYPGRKTFTIDFFVLFVFLVGYVPAELLHVLPAHQRIFFLDDERIAYPYKADTVPMWLVFVISVLVPFFAIIFVWVRLRLSTPWMWTVLGGFARTHMFSGLITLSVKSLVGRPRPHFLAQCVANVALCTGNVCPPEACTGEVFHVNEAYKSFPSGHTSTMFAGMTFLSLFIYHIAHTSIPTNLCAIVCCFLPMMAGVYVAITRTQDYKHHWEDVTVGALLGISMAAIFFEISLRGLRAAHLTI